jgi:heat shock protein HslJ
MYFRFIIFCALLICYFESCNNSKSSLNPENSKVEDLLGHTWGLYSFRAEDGTSINLNQQEIYEIEFAQNDTLNGRADCNSYFSEYLAKDAGIIEIRSIISTEVYCGEESHIDKYYKALGAVKVYEVNSKVLKLGFGAKGRLYFLIK